MDHCVWVLHILKAIHACPNATWKVCSHILVSKKSRRILAGIKETPHGQKIQRRRKFLLKVALILIHGDLYETRDCDALQGGPSIVCHNAVYKRLPKSLFCTVVGTRQSIASFPYCVNVLSTCAICVTCIFSGD